VITQEDNRWKYKDIKTTSLLGSVLAKNQAKRKGADDSWYTKDGFVTEGAASNAFIVNKEKVIKTHPLSSDILPGTTRSTVFEIAKLLDLTVKEEPFSVDEAIDSKEAFITGAGTLVVPVIKINQSVIGDGQPGEITNAIREKYLSIALS
jgi:D-alanine transaminase